MFLLDDEKPAFTYLNSDVVGHFIDDRALIICDHASNLIPKKLYNLGLSNYDLYRHIAYDIGISGVTRFMAQSLNLPAILGRFSRLVIDLNRPLDDMTSIREIYDHCFIEGNFNLSTQHKNERVEEIFKPYHHAIQTWLEKHARDRKKNQVPMIISMHSFSDCIQHKGKPCERPWHIGILSQYDRRLAQHALDFFHNHYPQYCVGDNLPYSGLDPYSYTMETHAYPLGLPNILFEIRQDLIKSDEQQKAMGKVMVAWLQDAMQNIDFYNYLTI